MSSILHHIGGKSSDVVLAPSSGNKRYPKNLSHLFAIVQEEGEPLRSYVQRFSNEIQEIPNISPSFLSGIMAQGLRNSGLADSFIGEPTSNWDELLARAERFILTEESRRIKGAQRPHRVALKETY
ncbi:hypothetical protein Salat_1594300 [Sesamum alatum]|uniref:Uncharacterized protein n=1 Tax=Sesamum alatum TaxID=300844 RepID=A0AAE2CJA2_9LAMI|nr:hypothetical protein Salat_1594300 [Sesamum alatum]